MKRLRAPNMVGKDSIGFAVDRTRRGTCVGFRSSSIGLKNAKELRVRRAKQPHIQLRARY